MAYDRFLDVHLKYGSNYDFEGDIADQRLYQQSRHGFKVVDLHGHDLNTIPRYTGSGYINVTVDLSDVAQATFNQGVSNLVRWVSKGSAGKLRINVHGDGNGNLCMKNGRGKWLDVDASRLVPWLISNKLQHSGLKTISLALCMAARAGKTLAVVDPDEQSAKAPDNSAVEKVCTALTQMNLHYIEVTGSSEIVSMSHEYGGHSGQLGRRVDIASDWTLKKTSGDQYKVIVGHPFKLRERNPFMPARIELPKTYLLQSASGSTWDVIHAFTNWRVTSIPSTGWVVIPNPKGGGILKLPVGWNVVADKNGILSLVFSSEGVKSWVSTRGTTCIWQRLAHSESKSRMVS